MVFNVEKSRKGINFLFLLNIALLIFLMSLVGCEEDLKEFTEVNNGIYLRLGQADIDNELDFADVASFNHLDFAGLHLSMDIPVESNGHKESRHTLGSS